MEITGELRNWELCNGCDMRPFPHYHGNLHGDSKGRFFEGQRVMTSPIVSGPDENGIVQTKYSVYKLVGPISHKQLIQDARKLAKSYQDQDRIVLVRMINSLANALEKHIPVSHIEAYSEKQS